MSPIHPEFDLINARLLSYIIQAQLAIYFFHNGEIHCDKYNQLKKQKLSILRDSHGSYHTVLTKKSATYYVDCHNIVLNLVEKVFNSKHQFENLNKGELPMARLRNLVDLGLPSTTVDCSISSIRERQERNSKSYSQFDGSKNEKNQCMQLFFDANRRRQPENCFFNMLDPAIDHNASNLPNAASNSYL